MADSRTWAVNITGEYGKEVPESKEMLKTNKYVHTYFTMMRLCQKDTEAN